LPTGSPDRNGRTVGRQIMSAFEIVR